MPWKHARQHLPLSRPLSLYRIHGARARRRRASACVGTANPRVRASQCGPRGRFARRKRHRDASRKAGLATNLRLLSRAHYD
eukprot:UN14315